MPTFCNQIGNFYDALINTLSQGAFATVSFAIIQTLFVAIVAAGFLYLFADFALENSGSGMASLMGKFFKHYKRAAIVGFFVAALPSMLLSIKASNTAVLSGVNAKIASSCGTILSNLLDDLRLGYNSLPVVEKKLAAAHPVLFGGVVLLDDGADNAKTKEVLDRLSASAHENATNQIKEGKILAASKDPATRGRGQAMIDLATNTIKDLDNASKTASASVKDAAAKKNSYGMVRGAIAMATNGSSELLLLIQWALAVVVGAFCLAPYMLMCVMTIWETIQGMIGIFTQLGLYICIVSLASTFALAIGPFAVLTFLFTGEESRHWRKYGDNFLTFWITASSGCLVMSIAYKTLVTPGITNFGGLVVKAGAVFFNQINAAGGAGEILMIAVGAGLILKTYGQAFQFFQQFLQKAPQAAIGVITGSFHP